MKVDMKGEDIFRNKCIPSSFRISFRNLFEDIDLKFGGVSVFLHVFDYLQSHHRFAEMNGNEKD